LLGWLFVIFDTLRGEPDVRQGRVGMPIRRDSALQKGNELTMNIGDAMFMAEQTLAGRENGVTGNYTLPVLFRRYSSVNIHYR
jgi:hypothetical protein